MRNVVARGVYKFLWNKYYLDALYELPFMRLAHPSYTGKIPGFATIKDSIIVSRGCAGGCTFCGLGFHQGKFLSSRSVNSVLTHVNRANRDCMRLKTRVK